MSYGHGYQESGEYEEGLLRRIYGGGAGPSGVLPGRDNFTGTPDQQDYLWSLGTDAQDDPNQFELGTPVAWFCLPGACIYCQANAAAGAVPYGTAFPDGSKEPPAHGRCGCWLQKVDPLAYQPRKPDFLLPDDLAAKIPGYWQPTPSKRGARK